MNKNKLITSILLLVLLSLSQMASALQMNPLSLVLKPSGGGAKQSFRVTNESNKPIAVQFSVMTRQQVNNREIRRPADKDFMIYPPQTIIPPRSTQKVRVEWLGTPNVKRELAYRLIAEQVYVSLEKQKQTGINMLMTLVGALYVQPNATKSDVRVKAVQRQGNKLAVTLANAGTRHQLMNYATLTLRNGNRVLSLKGNALKGINGNNVLAGSTKRFFIPLPKGFINGRWTATINYPR
jgi:fimbrial chaperone protein